MMKTGILGTGVVARTLGARLITKGNDVVIGTRDIDNTLARTEPDHFGNPPFVEWIKQHPKVKLDTLTNAAKHGEILINATAGTGSLNALTLAGAENLAKKILIDIANPLDFSNGFPPTLSVCNTDSLGEQIQAAFPDVRVVKTLNTMSSTVMVDPGLVKGDHNVFLSGNDKEAKAKVASLLTDWFGWKPKNIIDLGDIRSARGTEMLLPIWLQLYGVLQNPIYNFHIAMGEK